MTTTGAVGRALLVRAQMPHPSRVVESADINRLAQTAPAT